MKYCMVTDDKHTVELVSLHLIIKPKAKLIKLEIWSTVITIPYMYIYCILTKDASM